MLLKATTGSPALGPAPPRLAFYGRQGIGDLSAADTAIITDFGAGTSATMAELIMDLAMLALVIRVDIGMETASTTTVPSTM